MKNVVNLLGMAMTIGLLCWQCESFDEKNWEHNSLVYLEWESANPETEQRPVGITNIDAYFFPQDDISPLIKEKMHRSVAEFDVPTGNYDVLVVQGDIAVERTERFKTTTFVLPTYFNEEGERVITSNPDSMCYAGKVLNETINFDKKNTIVVPMERIFRKLNFEAEILDVAEIKNTCNVNLSGLAYQKKIWNNAFEESGSAVQIFDLYREGRFLNEKYFLNEFKGSVYSLGTDGLNILYFTFYDSKGNEHLIKCDITSYMQGWSGYEITVKIKIDLTDENMKFRISGWNETDEFNYVIKY